MKRYEFFCCTIFYNLSNENIGWNKAAYPFAKTDNGKDLQKKFNKALQELQKDGTLTKLSQKYFNEDVTKKTN